MPATTPDIHDRVRSAVEAGLVMEDVGIGAYEFWGQKCFDASRAVFPPDTVWVDVTGMDPEDVEENVSGLSYHEASDLIPCDWKAVLQGIGDENGRKIARYDVEDVTGC